MNEVINNYKNNIYELNDKTKKYKSNSDYLKNELNSITDKLEEI